MGAGDDLELAALLERPVDPTAIATQVLDRIDGPGPSDLGLLSERWSNLCRDPNLHLFVMVQALEIAPHDLELRGRVVRGMLRLLIVEDEIETTEAIEDLFRYEQPAA